MLRVLYWSTCVDTFETVCAERFHHPTAEGCTAYRALSIVRFNCSYFETTATRLRL